MKKRFLSLLAVIIILGCLSQQMDIWKADRLSALSEKSYQKAVKLYQRVFKRSYGLRQKGAIRLKLARLYFQRGCYQEAIAELRPLSSLEAKMLLAKSLYKNSDFTAALEAFNKIGESGDAEYFYYYGLTFEKNNLYDQALRLYSLIKSSPLFEAKAQERMAAINLITEKGVFAGVDEPVKKLIQMSPSQKEYPEASALYLLVDEDFYLSEDNRLVSDMHYVVKILNDRGKENFAEVTLSYDSTYETLELEYARTIRPDGTVVTVGDKNIRDVSLYLNFPLYSNARVRIISMPEISPGCVIEYKVKLSRAQLPNKKDFETTYWLQAGEPILWQRCTLNIPQNRNLKYKIINGDYNTLGYDMNPKVRQEGNRKIYSLEFKDVPQIIPEPLMPSLSRIDPYILFSTFESWEDIYRWWRNLYQDKIAADDDIKAKVCELIKDKKTPEEKLRAIYNFCTQDIRYVAVEYGDAGYEPHKASEIFKNKYGDCKDKAILLIAMLAEAGIEAFPVLISTLDFFDVQEDMPSLLFNHAIAATQVGEKLIFMDVTASTASFSDLPPGDQDRTALVFFKDKYQIAKTPLFEPDHDKISTQMRIKINKDESMEGQRQVDARGVYQQAQRYWLKFTMPILIEEGLKARVRAVADNAQLKEYEIKNVEDLDKPVVLKYTFKAPQYLMKAGKARIMDQLGGIDTSGLIKESRRYPMEFPTLSFDEDTIEIELPAHLAVKYLPAPVDVDTKWFHFVSRYELIHKKLVRFYFAHKRKEKIVAVDEYSAYKKAIEDMASLVNQQVVLEQTK